MIDVPSLPPTVQAVGLVGAVLVEALVLYLGYGALLRALGPTVTGIVDDT